MNVISVVITVAIAALIGWAVYKMFKNKGKCSGCSGDCTKCSRK